MEIPNSSLPAAFIEFLTGPLAGESYPLYMRPCTIGNAPGNDIIIPDQSVAFHHAQIVFSSGRWSIISFAYVCVNQEKGVRTRESLIVNGDAIHLGNTTFTFRAASPAINNTQESERTGVLISQPILEVTSNTDLNKNKPPYSLLGRESFSIGTDNSDDIFIETHSSFQAKIVHEKGHLTFIYSYPVSDTPVNRLYYKGEEVNEKLSQKLTPGDVYRISDEHGSFITLTYSDSSAINQTELIEHDESTGIHIKAKHLIKKVKSITPIKVKGIPLIKVKSTPLIDDVSLVIQPGHLVALVGSSGTGKSTLLDALSGMRPIKKGRVFYNGRDYYRNTPAFSTQLGYVPQEDSLHRALTVEHALSYAAKLRLPSDFKNRVDQVLEDVGLEEHRKKLISQLSGGQRKRVSIAMELLAKPNVFFLDEPTSGLDAGLDRKMMWLLRLLADRGCTIILATHTISNIDACDEVCWLANRGRLVYFGSPDDARKVFKRSNLAEVYSVLESQYKDENTSKKPKKPKKVKRRTLNSSVDMREITTSLLKEPEVQEPEVQADVETEKKLKSRRGESFKQFLTLSKRYVELLRNETGNLLLLLLQAPIIGWVLAFLIAPTTFNPNQIAVCPTNPVRQNSLIISGNCQSIVKDLATGQGRAYAAQQGMSAQAILQSHIALGSGANAQNALLILAFAAMMLGCINGCREIVKEWPIYRRERAFNLGIAPYLFSKVVVMGVLCLLESYILIELVKRSAPFHQGIILPPFLEIYITMALVSLAGLMTGLFISSISPNSNRALILLPVVLVPQIIFSGAVFPLDKQYLQIIGAFFPVRWALAAMGSTVGLHSDKLNADSFSYHGTLFSIYDKYTAALHLLLCWGMLAATCILLGILISVVLKSRNIRA